METQLNTSDHIASGSVRTVGIETGAGCVGALAVIGEVGEVGEVGVVAGIGAAAAGVGVAPLDASAANSENCESGCHAAIPSRQARSVPVNRPERSPLRTSSSEKMPRFWPPRLI
jgi:hypothetical protein